eukprot:scaffold52255_cov30-Attheya_sp.AAC.1
MEVCVSCDDDVEWNGVAATSRGKMTTVKTVAFADLDNLAWFRVSFHQLGPDSALPWMDEAYPIWVCRRGSIVVSAPKREKKS